MSEVVAVLLDSRWAVPAVLVGLLVLAVLFLVTRGGKWPE